MPKKQRNRPLPTSRQDHRDGELRIIGGTHRGRRIRYHGEPGTRPMKERVREAIFNLLGPRVKGKHAIDLFAGTGALALEALSRGAVRATLIERHFPTARLIRDNAGGLEFEQPVTVLEGDTFFFARQAPFDRQEPWIVFCSPPYNIYLTHKEQMLALIEQLGEAAPRDSLIVVESDEQFDPQSLPASEFWDVRIYRPAQIALTTLPWDRSDREGSESGNTD